METRPKSELVFLLDVDNTLLDNDRVKADITARLLEVLGEEGAKRFWELYEQVRKEFDVVNYPEVLRRFKATWRDQAAAQRAADLVNNWPYAQYVFPGSIPAIRHMETLGEVAILSDGDPIYQPRKIIASGLAEAVGLEDVLIYTHKETCFPDVMERFPGNHYVLVDDKEMILAHIKGEIGGKLTTIWVKQGHYAHDPAQYQKPDPDITLENIGDISSLDKADFMGARSA